jgi:hypothetical protein
MAWSEERVGAEAGSEGGREKRLSEGRRSRGSW